MTDEILNQARFLHKTIKSLQTRLLHRFGPVTITQNGTEIELTFTQLSTLAELREAGSMSLKALASATNVSAPSASSMVDKLLELGAVTREPGLKDRREIRIGLTQQGLDAVEKMESQMLQALGDTLEAIGPEQAARMVEVYKHIESLMESDKPESVISSQI